LILRLFCEIASTIGSSCETATCPCSTARAAASAFSRALDEAFAAVAGARQIAPPLPDQTRAIAGPMEEKPAPPGGAAVSWLFERPPPKKLPVPQPPWRAEHARPEGSAPFASADVFSVRRLHPDEEATSPSPAQPPLASPQPAAGWPQLRDEDHEAARCFDHGLALLANKQYVEGLRQWERAIALDPDNRTYQSNVKRLQARISREQSRAGRVEGESAEGGRAEGGKS